MSDGHATSNRVAEIRAAIDTASDEALQKLRDHREYAPISYREGFADGLERALLIIDRIIDAPNNPNPGGA